ncbi:ATP-binding cassette domain-containing protein [Liquorilactobacillus sicerae]|uniref:ATP-binding cassette domain-containing protein n=1 Tax=Liquorilactobacillus sicerae TaxID=1416943 RepID=UPI00247FC111|nr:ATP-binding cassette domain-containing protein [Liquorilactobacillus sicerae]
MENDGLILKNIFFRRQNKPILTNITVKIPWGRIVALLGENGVGKTTLLRIICDLNKGYHGVVNLNGVVDEKRKQFVSYSDNLEGFAKKSLLTKIIDFYELGYPDFDRQRAEKLLTFMQLDPEQRLGDLSKGSREKFVITLTLARKAKLYLLDEPLSGVDIFSRDKIISSLIKWIGPDAILIIATHHLNELEQIIDDAMILKDRRLLAYRDVEEIRVQEGLSVEEYYRQIYLEDRRQ